MIGGSITIKRSAESCSGNAGNSALPDDDVTFIPPTHPDIDYRRGPAHLNQDEIKNLQHLITIETQPTWYHLSLPKENPSISETAVCILG